MEYRAKIISSFEIHLLDLVVNFGGCSGTTIQEMVMLHLIAVSLSRYRSQLVKFRGIDGFKNGKFPIVSFLRRAPTHEDPLGELLRLVGQPVHGQNCGNASAADGEDLLVEVSQRYFSSGHIVPSFQVEPWSRCIIIYYP